MGEDTAQADEATTSDFTELGSLLGREIPRGDVILAEDPADAERLRELLAFERQFRAKDDTAKADEIKAKARDLQQSISAFTWRFKSIGTPNYEAIRAACAPTDAQLKNAKDERHKPDHNPETFYPKIVAACVEEVEDPDGNKIPASAITVAAIAFMQEQSKLTAGELTILASKCMALHLGTSHVVSVGKDFDEIIASA